MKCPYCNNDRDFKVTHSTHVADGVRRRRECSVCKERFTTAEIVINERFKGRGISNAIERQYGDKVVQQVGDQLIKSIQDIQRVQNVAAGGDNGPDAH